MSPLMQFELMVTLLGLALAVGAMMWLKWACGELARWWRRRARPGRRFHL